MLPKVQLYEGAEGLRFLLYENADHQGISGVIKSHGSYEPNLGLLSAVLINLAAEGRLVLDIGANLGSYSIPLALKFPAKTFVLFEPQRVIYYQLCGNIFLNGADNIIAINAGLGRKNGVLEVALPDYEKDHNIGAFSLLDDMHAKLRGAPNQGATDSIEIKTLDSLDYDEIALIKIDVEGAEMDVLVGALGTLVQTTIRRLFMRHGISIGTQLKRII